MTRTLVVLVSVGVGTVAAAVADAAQTGDVTIVLALIAATVAISMAVISAVTTIFIFRRSGVVLAKTETIVKKVDGLTSDLVTASVAQAKAEGQLSGEQAQRDRQAAPETLEKS